jgi:ABC-2 type transport system permease protein
VADIAGQLKRTTDTTGTVRTYGRIGWARIRAQLEYRLSFALDCLADVIAQATELVAIVVLFSQADTLGGLDRTGVLLIYAMASIGFGLADLVVGQIGGLPGYIRTGGLDVLLLRPLSALGQLLISDVQLRRIGRLLTGLGVAGYVLATAGIEWTLARVALVIITPLAGATIVGSIWVASSALSFWLVEGQEMTSAVTHGTNLFTSYPLGVYPTWLRRLLAFVIPGAFVSYYPTLALLGQPDPLGAPTVLAWLAAPVAALAALGSGLVWRHAMRHYQGTGS